MIGRRAFITLLGGAAAWPFAARAQQAASSVRQVRVGLIATAPLTPAMLNAFRDGMREHGYTEGQNLSIAVRWPQGSFDQDPSVVTELINSNVDVIVAWASPTVIAVRRATSTIPIVMVVSRRSDWFGVHRQSGATGRQYHWPHQHLSRSQCQADGTVCRTGSRHETRRRGSQPQQSGRDHGSSGDRGRCP
jgi:hypothetical protein